MGAVQTDSSRPAGGLSLRANFAWLAGGRVLYATGQWLVLVIVAKLASIEAVGLYSLGLAICGPVVGFAMLGLRRVHLTDAGDEYRFGHYLALRSLCAVGASLVIGVLAVRTTDTPEDARIVGLVGLVAVIRMQADIVHGLFQKQERLDFSARSMAIRGFVSPLLLACGIVIGGSVAWGVVAQILGSLAVLLAYDVPRGRLHLGHSTDVPPTEAPPRLRPLFEASALRRLAWQALPLGFVTALASLVHQVPRYFIVDRMGVEALGYFAVMIYIVSAGNRLVTALGSAAIARLARLHAAGEVGEFALLLAKLAGVSLFFGVAGFALAAIAGEWILATLYAPEYAQYADVLRIVMVAGVPLFLATTLQVGVTAARHFRLQIVHYAWVVLVSVLAGYLLIDPPDLHGAAYAVLAAYVASLAGVLAMNTWSLRALRASSPMGDTA